MKIARIRIVLMNGAVDRQRQRNIGDGDHRQRTAKGPQGKRALEVTSAWLPGRGCVRGGTLGVEGLKKTGSREPECCLGLH
jgi:hypothetical protein